MAKKERKQRQFKVGKYDPPSFTFASAKEYQDLCKRVRRRWRQQHPIIVQSIVGHYGARNGG